MSIADELPDKLREWRADPVAFVRQALAADPEPWQIDALSAFARCNRIAMKACKGPGKTCVLAWIIWNFLLTRDDAQVACTSISADNMRDGLWKELTKWYGICPLLQKHFDMQRERIVHRRYPGVWWCSARTWAKDSDSTAQSNTLAGLHNDSLLFVGDEAGGIPDAIMATAEAGLSTGGDTKIVIAGNPTELSGALHSACVTHRKFWHVVEITGDPDSPSRSRRVDVDYARQQIVTHGRYNPWVLVNIFGEFPPEASNALMGIEDVNRAINRVLRPGTSRTAAKIIGFDCALYGDDRAVAYPRQGLAAFKPIVMRNKPPEEQAARLCKAYRDWDADAVFIDSTGGFAAEIPYILTQAGVNVIKVNFGAEAMDPAYTNRRVEMWLEMAKWIKGGGMITNDYPEIIQELTAPTYGIKGAKFDLESKKDFKKRIGHSPDLADALALTFAMPVVAKSTKSPTKSAMDDFFEDHPMGSTMLTALNPARGKKDLGDAYMDR